MRGDWGPPNHAAHTAGHVQVRPTPLRPPPPEVESRRDDGPLSRVAFDQLEGYRRQRERLDAVGAALGHGWTVQVWFEPNRFRHVMQARHHCDFEFSASVERFDGSEYELSVALTQALLMKERRHPCEAISGGVR